MEVLDTAGKVLATLATYSNLDRGAGYTRKGPFDLLTYRGQTIRLQFRATTNGSSATKFRIDDVEAR